MMSKEFKDTMQIIDRTTLEVVRRTETGAGQDLRPRRIHKGMASTCWPACGEMDGALIIYDAETLKEVKRLPMKKPVGKLQRNGTRSPNRKGPATERRRYNRIP